MKIAIVGAGITGLYLAYKISKRYNYEIDIYEKTNRIGGRIESIIKDKHILELGAGRLNGKQKRIMKLLKELDLMKDLILLKPETSKYIKDGHVYSPKKIALPYYSNKYLQSVTLDNLLRKHYTNEDVDDMKYAFGYDSEFISSNAYDALKSMNNDLNDESKFYVLKNGMISIINKLKEKLDLKHVKIHLKTEFKQSDEYDKVIFTGTTEHIKYESVIGDSLCKIYAKFPPFHSNSSLCSNSPLRSTPSCWFKDIGHVTTNNQIRQFIPINREESIAIVSYSSNKWADHWNKLTKKQLKKELMDNLKKTFPSEDIPEPIWIEKKYWKVGSHSWGVNPKYYKSNRSNKEIISGEIVSRNHHSWIEGSLESANKTLKSI